MHSLDFGSLRKQIIQIVMLATSGVLLTVCAFTTLEPTVSQAVTSQFSIRQQVTSEISFTLAAANVTMNGALLGITGGNATGSVSVAVLTNSTTGYTMDISFQNTPAMQGEVTNSTAIRNYGSTTEPTYLFFGSTSAQFAYTVAASSSSDVDPSFLNNGTACNTGTTMTANTCWMGATSTSNFRIINRNTAAATTTATTTLQFRVNIPPSPIPAVSSDFYTATATLTAVTQ
jgi:hypothetical protein